MNRITTLIKRQWLAEIAAGVKKVEYREDKQYWRVRIHTTQLPFELRMINGMSKTAPEVTVLIDWWELRDGMYGMHIAKVLNVRNWPLRKKR